MTADPIIPTRIIPPGAPLPTIDGPPGPDDVPPWWEPAPPRPAPPDPEPEPEQRDEEPAAADAPPPINLPPGTLIVLPPGGADLSPVDAAEPRWWERVLAHLRPWHSALGITLAFVPIPGVGYGAAPIWQSAVWYGHEENLLVGYGLAAVGVLVAYRAERRLTGGWLRTAVTRAMSVTALVGLTGAIDLWDPIQIWTGVPLP